MGALQLIPQRLRAAPRGISTACYGPGYRVYFQQRGTTLVILLCGGDKGSQARDIEAAKRLARDGE